MDVEHLGPEDGVAVQSLQVARALQVRRHEVIVTFQNDGPYRPDYVSAGVTLTKVASLGFGLRRPQTLVRTFPAAVRAGLAARPDVVYDSLLWTLPWASAIGTLRRVPVVSHVHGFGPEERLPALFGRPLRRSRRVISVSDFYRRRLEGEGVEPALIRVVHNGIDLSTYSRPSEAERFRARSMLGLRPTSFVILFYGRVDATKGVDVLIEAALRLRHGRPDLDFDVVVAGLSRDQGYLADLHRRAESLSLHWLPLQADVVPLLHAADVVAVPSVWDEPFARVVIEGLSAGLPVVASRVGGIPELLSGPLDRYLVDKGDPDALAVALAALVDWRTTDPGLSERHRSHVRAHFSLDQMVDGIEGQLVAATGG